MLFTKSAIIPRAAVSVVAAAALVIAGAGIAGAVSPSPKPAPKIPTLAHTSTLAHTNAVGPSPRIPSSTTGIHATVAACKLVDTTVRGGKILSGNARSYVVRGSASHSSQGGASGGCAIPDTATSVDVVLTVSGATAKSGSMTWTPQGSTHAYRVVSYSKNQTTTVATQIQAPSAATSTDGTLKNTGGAASVSMTAIGYTAPPIAGMVDPSGGIFSGSTRLLSAVHNGTGSYTVTADTDVSYCTPTVTAYSGHVYASAYGFDGSHIWVTLWLLNTTTHAETPFDGYFYLSVSC